MFLTKQRLSMKDTRFFDIDKKLICKFVKKSYTKKARIACPPPYT